MVAGDHDVAKFFGAAEKEGSKEVRIHGLRGCLGHPDDDVERQIHGFHPAQEHGDVWLVESCGEPDQIPKMFRGALAVAHKKIAGGLVVPSPDGGEPAGGSDME